MLALVQRVSQAAVRIEGKEHARIGQGLLVFLGVHSSDSEEDVAYLLKKIIGLRIFSDAEGKMNLDLAQIQGEILLISQFTLYAQTRKGNRPSFIEAAGPDLAIPLYESMVQGLKAALPKVNTGVFGADMMVDLCNDGPVTILLDSQDRLNSKSH